MSEAAEVKANADNDLKELASLARLVSYARQSAKGMKAEFPAYCLDLALGALIQELGNRGVLGLEPDDRFTRARSAMH